MYLIVIEGNIAAGKTTLMKNLQKDAHKVSFLRNVLFSDEPVQKFSSLFGDDKLNPLQEYYNNKKNSFAFQNYVLDCYKDRFKTIDLCSTPDQTIILDRGLDSCSLFTELIKSEMTSLEIEYLKQKETKLIETFPVPSRVDSIFYIDVKPETALERVEQRCRAGENKIDLSYLQQLQRQYSFYLTRESRNIPVEICKKDTAEDIFAHFMSFMKDLAKRNHLV